MVDKRWLTPSVVDRAGDENQTVFLNLAKLSAQKLVSFESICPERSERALANLPGVTPMIRDQRFLMRLPAIQTLERLLVELLACRTRFSTVARSRGPCAGTHLNRRLK